MRRLLFTIFIALAVATAAVGAMNWVSGLPVSALSARWAQPPSQFLDINGMKVHVRDEGPVSDPLPIILLHGTSSSLHTWDGWVRELKNDHRVITLDLPGFGLTGPSPHSIYTVPAYAGFVRIFMDALHIGRCILGGNSLGGDIAWQSADAMPGRVTKLILVDSGGYPLHPESIPIGFKIANTPVLNRVMEKVLPRFFIEASLRDVYGDPSKVTPETVDLYYGMAIREGNLHALIQRFQQQDSGANADRIPALKLPTLILWGSLDRLLPLDDAERFHRDIAGSELVILKGLGHVPQEEDPQASVAAVKAFLARS